MSQQTLSMLIRGLHHAAQSTHRLLAHQYVELFREFFDEKGNESEPKTLRAKMVEVELQKGHIVRVPLITLVAPRGIALDKMKVELSVRLVEKETKTSWIMEDGHEINRSNLKIQHAPRSSQNKRRKEDVIDIEVEFKAGEPPEGVMRVLEQFLGTIDPIGPKDARRNDDRYMKRATVNVDRNVKKKSTD